jgi:hypothetical protein
MLLMQTTRRQSCPSPGPRRTNLRRSWTSMLAAGALACHPSHRIAHPQVAAGAPACHHCHRRDNACRSWGFHTWDGGVKTTQCTGNRFRLKSREIIQSVVLVPIIMVRLSNRKDGMSLGRLHPLDGEELRVEIWCFSQLCAFISSLDLD